MRYTKYQYKQKTKNPMILILPIVITITVAVAVGILLAKLFFNSGVQVPIIDPGGTTSKEVSINESQTFTMIQCGAFSKEDGAKSILATVKGTKSAFIIKDENKLYRVSAGIYLKDDAEEVAENVTKAGTKVAKINYVLEGSDVAQGQIAGIIQGELQIIKTLESDEVAAVKTAEFKKWVMDLETVNSDTDGQKLKELKEHIAGLKDELKISDVENEYIYLYSILYKYKK